MARARLATSMLASILCFLTAVSPAADAQTGVRAVAFSGAGCLYNTNVQSAFSASPMLEISAWYGFQSITAGTDQTLVSSNTNGIGATNVVDLHIENIVGDPNLANGSHLYLTTNDGTTPGAGQQYSQWVSNEVLPATHWHNIYVASDTSQTFSNGMYTVVVFLDGVELTPNSTYTHGNMTNQSFFSTPYFQNNLNNSWHVGCYYNPVSGQRNAYYNGDLAEVYAAPLSSALIPDLTPFGAFKPVTGLWGPIELGNFCLAPYPAGDPPTLCLPGGASTFNWNLYPSVSNQFVPYPNSFGTPTATDDPFIAIQ